MINQHTTELRSIRRALLSVSDKTGLIDFARVLRRFEIELLSTGGTSKILREAGIDVRDVSEVTGFPEMLDGRIKTLHPRIHGGLLAVRRNTSHMAALSQHNIEAIDLVVVNLYPFEQTIDRVGVPHAEAIEQIDIGGPALIRSAAKNYNDVAVVVAPELYAVVIAEMNRTGGALSHELRGELARKAFARTAQYDLAVASYLDSVLTKDAASAAAHAVPKHPAREPKTPATDAAPVSPQPATMRNSFTLMLNKIADLRYGENPHQTAALYDLGDDDDGGVAQAPLLSGKEMSFNNYVDADAAWQLVSDLEMMACAIIKHTNPAGASVDTSAAEAYRRALATDPVSAFGGVVAFNCPVDEAAARAVTEIFTEVVIAPAFSGEALELLSAKKNLRILQIEEQALAGPDYKRIGGGMLVQTRDIHHLTGDQLQVVTKRAPTPDETTSLLFAWSVCKHTRSNAIVYARERQTIGVGAGQMSRVDSVRIGAMRARLPLAGSVLASDAFFPFRDGVDEAARRGITAVIQPGGSVRDAEVIAAADEHGLAMVFTGVRHFKH